MSKRALKAQSSPAPAQERTGVVTASAPPTPPLVGPMDWGHLPFFLELVRTGSLARAGKRLGADRTTVARRVAALESELGLPLFERGPQGWIRTAAGDELAELATRVEEDVLALARHADARDREVAGTVRITTPTHVAVHLLAPAVPLLRERHPSLLVEVAADQRTFDLTRREADIAVRFGRPQAPGLVTRKLSEVAYRLYASPAYLAGRGAGPADVDRDAFVGFEERLISVPQERWLDRVFPDRHVVFRCNSTAALVAAARAGVGVAVLPCFMAATVPDLEEVEAPEPVAAHEMWLLVHGDLRRTPRVKAAIGWIDDVVAAARPALCGE
jgi:DNA-binding transcriptional LysR family regulator